MCRRAQHERWPMAEPLGVRDPLMPLSAVKEVAGEKWLPLTDYYRLQEGANRASKTPSWSSLSPLPS